MPRPSRWQAKHKACQEAVTNVATDLKVEIERLTTENREYRSLLECTEFALDWLTLYHVIEKEGADWKSKFDGSAFYACDCSEDGGYMEYDTNAYIHTERCASGFEDSLAALHDQIKRALGRE
jgi:hypothetical protein